jgi:hypothetical protein
MAQPLYQNIPRIALYFFQYFLSAALKNVFSKLSDLPLLLRDEIIFCRFW